MLTLSTCDRYYRNVKEGQNKYLRGECGHSALSLMFAPMLIIISFALFGICVASELTGLGY